MFSFEELINGMAKRPQMYVHPLNVSSIENFVGGFLVGTGKIPPISKFDFNSPECVYASFFGLWVVQWIIDNINSEYKLCSELLPEILLKITKDEDEAVKLYFSLCEKFFECYHNNDEAYFDALARKVRGWDG